MACNGSLVGIAIQAEHGDKTEHDAALTLAVFDGAAHTLPDAALVPKAAGRAGDIAA